MTSFIDAINNDRYNKITQRIKYLREQIAASGWLDGYVLEGHQKELTKLEKELTDYLESR